jgi:hypothetical protein
MAKEVWLVLKSNYLCSHLAVDIGMAGLNMSRFEGRKGSGVGIGVMYRARDMRRCPVRCAMLCEKRLASSVHHELCGVGCMPSVHLMLHSIDPH